VGWKIVDVSGCPCVGVNVAKQDWISKIDWGIP
jgi:hypothetical protein